MPSVLLAARDVPLLAPPRHPHASAFRSTPARRKPDRRECANRSKKSRKPPAKHEPRFGETGVQTELVYCQKFAYIFLTIDSA